MASQVKHLVQVKPEVLQAALLDEIAERLYQLQKFMDEGRAQGIVEPLNPVKVSTEPTVLEPPSGKPWFGVTIVKEDPVELNIIINSGKSSSTPYTMSRDERVFDQYFNSPCVHDVVLWTNEGTCTVKVRGSR